MTSNDLITLKFKYKRTTVVLLVDSTKSVASIKEELCFALNNTNALGIVDNDDEGLDDEIDIPKPSFETEDSETKAEDKNDSNSYVESSKIKLAFVKNDDCSDFKEMSDDAMSLKDLEVKDKMIIAFSISDSDFQIDVPVDTYED